MTVHLERMTWADPRPIAELLKQAQEGDVGILVVEPQPAHLSPDLVDRTIQRLSAGSPIVVVRDRGREREQLRALPSLVNLIAVLPDVDSAVMDVNFLVSQPDLIARADSLCELVVLAAESGLVAIEDTSEGCTSDPSFERRRESSLRGDSDVENLTHSQQKWTPKLSIPKERPSGRERCISHPHLTTPSSGPRAPWLRAIIERLTVPNASHLSTGLMALKAGLFLMNDFFDESHANSQSIEGKGPHRTGDYWHAILHRREPDYANSKYWFRQVGRHPVFADLGRSVAALWSSVPGNLAGPLARWRDRVVPRGDWDPNAFVDLCAAAEQDVTLRPWCEQIQHTEMVLLLDWTWKEMQ